MPFNIQFKLPLLILTSILLLSFSSLVAAKKHYPKYHTCELKNQSGTIDISFCRKSDTGKIRCYADINWNNNKKERIWGNECWSSYSDCWSDGDGRVGDFCQDR